MNQNVRYVVKVLQKSSEHIGFARGIECWADVTGAYYLLNRECVKYLEGKELWDDSLTPDLIAKHFSEILEGTIKTGLLASVFREIREKLFKIVEEIKEESLE